MQVAKDESIYAMLPSHAMAQARTEPPSEQRSAEARASGHAPKTLVVFSAVALASLSASLSWLMPPIAHSWRNLFAQPLTALARGLPLDAESHLRGALQTFAPLLASLLLVAGVSSALVLAIVQGFRFRLWPARPRHAFPASGSSRLVTFALIASSTAVVLATCLYDALWMTTNEQVTDVLQDSALRISVALLLVAACDAALARAAFWRSLWMTRQERLDESREAYGSPELRAARERSRRELGKTS
jgi:flagellar biosynthesis protein FlhB